MSTDTTPKTTTVYRTRVTGYSVEAKIQPFPCTASTEKTVTILEESATWGGETKMVPRRQARMGETYQYHETWEAAHAHLIERATEQVEHVRERLRRANDVLGNVKGLKKEADHG